MLTNIRISTIYNRATDSWVLDSRGNAIMMIICRDLRKAGRSHDITV